MEPLHIGHVHGSPSVDCTDPNCRHVGDRYRHVQNCDPEAACPIGSAPLFIGIGGYATSGKDALADVLVELHHFNKQFTSSALRQAMLTLNPWVQGEDHQWHRYADYEELAGSYEAAKTHPEVRRLLQVIGVDIGRLMFGVNVCVDWLRPVVAGLMAQGTSVVVTGIRYPDELEWVRSAGGTAVWVGRPGVGPVNGHSSDNTLGPEDFDIRVQNDGTLADLAGRAGELVRKLRPELAA
jgi:hypothetical protein